MAYTRIKYSKGIPYLYRVESYREDGKVKQRVLQYLGRVNIDSQITQIKSALQTSEFQEKEMQKRADWNQEGKREMYEEEVKQEQEEQIRLKKKLIVYERHQKKLGTTKTKRLGTTFQSDLKQNFDQIDKSGFKGGMVPIPELYRKMKKDYSKEEFRQELLELEKKRTIDLQTASDTKLISKKDREGGFYLKDGEIYNFDERPGPTKRGYINYVVWRR